MEFKNETIYHRDKHETNYSVISNSLINDDRLTGIERFIMILILSNCDTYIINLNVIQKRVQAGQKTFQKSITNLKKYGYITQLRKRGSWLTTITECPSKPIQEVNEPIKPIQETQIDTIDSPSIEVENSIVVNTPEPIQEETIQPVNKSPEFIEIKGEYYNKHTIEIYKLQDDKINSMIKNWRRDFDLLTEPTTDIINSSYFNILKKYLKELPLPDNHLVIASNNEI